MIRRIFILSIALITAAMMLSSCAETNNRNEDDTVAYVNYENEIIHLI